MTMMTPEKNKDIQDLLTELPSLEEMQKHSEEMQEYSKKIQERFEEIQKRSEHLRDLTFKLNISDAEIQEIVRNVFNGTHKWKNG